MAIISNKNLDYPIAKTSGITANKVRAAVLKATTLAALTFK